MRRTLASGLAWGCWLCAAACSRPQTQPVAEGSLVAPETSSVADAPAQPAEPPEPEVVAPVATPDSEAAHARALARLLPKAERLPALVPAPRELPPPPSVVYVTQPAPVALEGESPGEDEVVHDGTMPGWFVPIVDPAHGSALASFHAALEGLAEGRDPDGKVRVAMYGASGTAADVSVGYLRTYLQARFGDGGPGFVPLAPLTKWYRHNEVIVRAVDGWRKETSLTAKGRHDGLYGLLGASFTATAAKRWAQVIPKEGSTSCEGIAHAELFFLRQPRGGAFSVVIDDGPPEVVRTAAEAVEPGYHALALEPGPHTIRVETLGKDEVRVFGVVLERAEPGVVVDVLGIDGARGRSLLEWDEAVWADNLRRRAPDLYTLSYGTNESVDPTLSVPLYAEDVREQLRRFRRALPTASCVLLGPVDFPVIDGDRILPRPVLREIVEAQRQVAAEEGCGFWDGIAFMGGELSMPAWVTAQPPLARKDHLHYTRLGGARKGMALADALMQALDARARPREGRPDDALGLGLQAAP